MGVERQYDRTIRDLLSDEKIFFPVSQFKIMGLQVERHGLGGSFDIFFLQVIDDSVTARTRKTRPEMDNI